MTLNFTNLIEIKQSYEELHVNVEKKLQNYVIKAKPGRFYMI